jgi:beta-lactamase class A
MPQGQKLLLLCFTLAIVFLSLNAFTNLSFSFNTFNIFKQAQAETEDTTISAPFTLSKTMPSLQNQLRYLIDSNKKVIAGIFLFVPTTGEYININGMKEFPAASLIKIPVLVSLLQAIDQKRVSLNDKLIIHSSLIGGGSGFLQWRPHESTVTVAEAAELMIIFSDNTATNLIIDLLGGKNVLNEQFSKWGLKKTQIANWLPDFDGTNKTSPYDLVFLLAKIDNDELISQEMKAFMYKIMARTRTRTLLPMGLPAHTKIIHKTGDIASLVGDAGIIEPKLKELSNKRYFIAVQVERKHNDRSANMLIRDISKTVYNGLMQND